MTVLENMARHLAGMPPVREKPHTSIVERSRRVGAFQRAVVMVGQKPMADGLGVALRTVQSYSGVERGISDATLTGAAKVLEERAAVLMAAAGELRGLTEGGQ